MRSLIASLILVASPVLADASQIESPLRVTSQAPLQSVRLGLLPVAPANLEKGESRIYLSGTWTNVWVNDQPGLLLDYEALDSRIAASVALSDVTQLEIEFEERSRFGGLLDPFIQNFHRQIGNGLNGRDSVPRGSVNIVLRDPASNEVLVSRHDVGAFSRGVSLSLGRSRTSNRGRLGYAATVRVPLRHSGEELAPSTDVGVSGSWSRNFRRTSVHLGGGLTRFGTTEVDRMRTSRYQRTGLAAVVQPVTRRTSAVVQYLFNEGVAERGALGRNAHEVTLGARLHVSADTAVEVGLIENFINYDNGPDFGIHLAVSRTR